jgi:hypothetical protein
LCAALLVLAVVVRVRESGVADRSPDEKLWTEFGAGIARSGPAYVTRLVHEFNRDADVEFPWPWRAGYSCLVGAAMRVSGHTGVRVAEAVSLVSSAGVVAVAGLIALSFLEPWAAVVAMLFLAVSPLDLALARRAWQDDVLAFTTALMLWAFLAHALRGGRAAAVAFLALGAFSLTVKESAVIAFGLGVLGLAIRAWRRHRRWREPAFALAAGAAAGLAALGFVVAISGGPRELAHLLALAREANAPDEYMRQYQSGGPGYYLTGLRLLQPVPFALGAAATLLALVHPAWLAPCPGRGHERAALRVLAVLVSGFSLVAFAYASKNMRFLSPLFAPVALLGASLVVAGLGRARARLPRAAGLAIALVVAGALGASAVRDYRRFDHYFNEMEIQDLATPWFLQADAQEARDAAAPDSGR